jgi:hypothetical protein
MSDDAGVDGPMNTIPLLAAAVRANQRANNRQFEEIRSRLDGIRTAMITLGVGIMLAIIGASVVSKVF